MGTSLTQETISIVDSDDYAWLQRHCNQLTHNAEAGADLTQETLVEAWRNRHKLTDPHGRRAWLAAIARNVFRRWLRTLQYEAHHLTPSVDAMTALQSLTSDDDFVHDLERDELAQLLDHALALLSPDLRQAVLAHYVEDQPQQEIAARLGISQGTLAVRLHRGRLRLQQIFATTMHDEAAAFGLDAFALSDWQETRQWCFLCGQQRMWVRFDRASLPPYLQVKCPKCGQQIDHRTQVIAEARSPRAALERIFDWVEAYYLPATITRKASCMHCGELAPLQQSAATTPSDNGMPFVKVVCTCPAMSTCWVPLFALTAPVGRAFRRDHARMRLASITEQEYGGVAAKLITFASVIDNAQLHLAVARDTHRSLNVWTA